MRKIWKVYLDRLPQEQKNSILYNAIAHLIEIEEVGFRMDDYVDENGNEIPDDGTFEECLYWKTNGEDLRDG